MNGRILLVDNDGDLAAVLRRHLEHEGWTVTAVTGGEVEDLRLDAGVAGTAGGGVRPTLAEVEAACIRRILAETKGDKRAAARILGVHN